MFGLVGLRKDELRINPNISVLLESGAVPVINLKSCYKNMKAVLTASSRKSLVNLLVGVFCKMTTFIFVCG